MIAEDIYQKSQSLSKPLALEVLHFIEFLQTKQSHPVADDVNSRHNLIEQLFNRPFQALSAETKPLPRESLYD